MRALVLALAALATACSPRPCTPGTLFLSVSFPNGAEQADTVDITLTAPGGAARTHTVDHSPSARSWSVEIDFSGAYPAGQALGLTLTARAGTQMLATHSQTIATQASCTAVDAHLDRPVVSLVAGALGGPGNADGIGSVARFNTPNGMVTDGAGNLYIADSGNNAIRKMVLATGEVSTVAGGNSDGGSNDGATSVAQLRLPRGLALDGAGNLYVADYGNHTIRQIALAHGAVSTVAGAPGLAGSRDGPFSTFDYPLGLALDGAGALYIADSGNNTIRKLVLATGVVSTVAGVAGKPGTVDGIGGAALLNHPVGLANDGAGNLYFADASTTIRKLALATGAVTTVAGAANTPGFIDDTGSKARFRFLSWLAVDGAGSLFACDDTTIRKLELATATVTTVAGTAGMPGSSDGPASSALFVEPSGVATDGAASLYISDGQTIRKLARSTALVSTSAGMADMQGSSDGVGAAARFYLPSGLASDGAGNLFVADLLNHAIRKLVLETGAVTTLVGGPNEFGIQDGVGGAAQLSGPGGLLFDGAGNLYFADSVADTIRKLELATGAVTTIAGKANVEGSSSGIGSDARFDCPIGLAGDGAGNLYIADQGNLIIRKLVLATGLVMTIAGSAGMTGSSDGVGADARFNVPTGLAADTSGNLYIADQYNHTIRKLVLATGEVSTLVGTAGAPGSVDDVGPKARLTNPVGVSVDQDGNLYVADRYSIRKIISATGAVIHVAGVGSQSGASVGPLPTSIASPLGIVALPAGEIVFSTQLENSIFKIQ